MGLLGLLVAGHFLDFVDRGLPAALAPQIKADFRLSDAQLGALQGPAFIGLYTLAALVSVNVVGRPYRLRVMAACVLAWSAGGVLFALARDMTQLFAGRLLVGLGQALFAPCALAVIADHAPAAVRGRALSTFTAGSATGRSAAFLLGGLALGLISFSGAARWTGLAPWRLAVLTLTAPNLALAAGLVLAREVAPASTARSDFGGAARGWLRGRVGAVLAVAAASAAGVTVVQTTTAWGASILHRQFGAAPAAAALAFGAALVPAALLGHLGGGLATDRLARRGLTPLDLLVAGLCLAAAGAAAAVAAPMAWMAGAGLALGCLGGSVAALAGLVGFLAVSPAAARGRSGAVFMAATSLVGFGVGPLTAGWLSDRHGLGPTALAGALAHVAAAAAVVGTVAALAGRAAWRRAERAAADE